MIETIEREPQRYKGKLKVFFGYCAGVGKTYAMLQEAQMKLVEGVDVVIGYIEPHGRKETFDLIYGLPQIPTQKIQYKGTLWQEFDLDAALKRKPELILVDELAHTNVTGCRHHKRYSDVEELLKAGIDVYTTLNVQHLESLHDVVEGITRVKVNERIPDRLFDQASDVKLIDLEVPELLQRLRDGKIYDHSKIQSALAHFFLEDNLIALRSIALRRCAERVNLITTKEKRVFTQEHILVCIGTSPTNERVIRTASRMVQAFHGEFTALYVESEEPFSLSMKAQTQLQNNLHLAQSLGANLVSTYGEDIAYQISQYAKTSSVSKLVMGRSYQKPSFFHRKTLIDQLTLHAPDLEIYIIPDARLKASHLHTISLSKHPISWKDALITCTILFITTLLCLCFFFYLPNITNIVLIFVLAACLIAFITTHPLYPICTAFYSILAINFLFVEPRFTLHMNASEYPLILICMIIVSFTISFFTRKLKKETILASRHAHRLDILLETTQKLLICNQGEEVMRESCFQIQRMLKRWILYYPVQHHTLAKPYFSDPNLTEETKALYTCASEQAVAKWVLENNKNAGASTHTLPNAKAFYLAIRKDEEVFAVIGIAMEPHEDLLPYEKSLLLAMLNEIALSLDALKQQQKYNEMMLRAQWMEALDKNEI